MEYLIKLNGLDFGKIETDKDLKNPDLLKNTIYQVMLTDFEDACLSQNENAILVTMTKEQRIKQQGINEYLRNKGL